MLPIATQFSVTKVIRKNEDDIWIWLAIWESGCTCLRKNLQEKRNQRCCREYPGSEHPGNHSLSRFNRPEAVYRANSISLKPAYVAPAIRP